MYNGIGLDTARGSGTNGYVQRNVAFIRRHKDRVDYKSEEELKKLDQTLNKGPNPEILDHDRKRKVELKCLEMHELMEEQGYSAEEIEKKVAIFRKMLTEKEGVSERAVERDEAGRPVAKETHQLAEAAVEKTQQLRAAFGLSEFYQDGSSFDPNRKAKEKELEAKAMAEKKYAIVRSSSSSRSPSPVPKKKKKKSNRNRSETPSPSRGKKKKSKKQKRERSESPKPKDKHKQKKKKKHRSPSPSDSESNSDSDSDTDSSRSPSPKPQTKKKSTKNGDKPRKEKLGELDDIDRSPSAVNKNGNKTPLSDRITSALVSENNNKKLKSRSPQEKSRSIRSKPSRSRTPKSKRSRSKTPRRSRSKSPRRKRSKSYSRSRSRTPKKKKVPTATLR